MKKLDQRHIKYIGAIKNLLTRSTFYVSILNFGMLAVTSYSVVLKSVIAFPFWAFMLMLIAIVAVAMCFEYIIMLPSETSFMNRQSYMHDNPIRRDLEEIKTSLEEINKREKQ